jgi:maltokinase
MSEPICLDVEARWFAGKGRTVTAVTRADALGPLALADVAYEDGEGERYLLTPEDAGAWAAIVQNPPAGSHGTLELRRGPAFEALTGSLDGASTPSLDQTNTLVVLGGRLLVKAYRRLEPGVHPEVELLAALAATDAGRASDAGATDAPVPRFAGSLHYVPDDGGEPTALALLQEFVPGTVTGWEPPILGVVDLLRGMRREKWVSQTQRSHLIAAAAPYRAAGRATAALHAALAAALPTRSATQADRAAWRADAERTLGEAANADPAFDASLDAIRQRFAALDASQGAETAQDATSEISAETLLTRTHGDLHYAQFLRTGDGRILTIDFEGDPTRPLADRRRLDTPLRDLACLLRSIDHIGSAASRRVDWADPGAWIAAARDQALAGYAELAPEPLDLPLLHALELAKECGEAIYAHRVLPEWAYVAPRGLRRLLEMTPDPHGPST